MAQIRTEHLVLGMVATNTYLLKNTDTEELLIVDPADEAGIIQNKILEMKGKPAAVLLTHGHFDHMMAAEALKTRYGIPVLASREEQGLLNNPAYNLSGAWATPCTLAADQWLEDGEWLDLAGCRIQVLHTPGHTAGSCCFYLPEEKLLFSGDTLFAESVGRTDFPTSSAGQMQESLLRLLKELPEETHVYPGHGEETTIAYEKRYNPFAYDRNPI